MSDAKKYLDSAQIKYDRGDYTGAIADCDKAIELEPNFALAYHARGFAKAKLKEYEGAIKDYDKAIELDPKLAGAYFEQRQRKR